MKLLANENFPRLAVEALRATGYDVLWARTDMPGAADDSILERRPGRRAPGRDLRQGFWRTCISLGPACGVRRREFAKFDLVCPQL